jgi:hypothetical protein
VLAYEQKIRRPFGRHHCWRMDRNMDQPVHSMELVEEHNMELAEAHNIPYRCWLDKQGAQPLAQMYKSSPVRELNKL